VFNAAGNKKQRGEAEEGEELKGRCLLAGKLETPVKGPTSRGCVKRTPRYIDLQGDSGGRTPAMVKRGAEVCDLRKNWGHQGEERTQYSGNRTKGEQGGGGGGGVGNGLFKGTPGKKSETLRNHKEEQIQEQKTRGTTLSRQATEPS